MPLAAALRRSAPSDGATPEPPFVRLGQRRRRAPRPRAEPRRGLLAAAGGLTVLVCTALGAAVATSSNARREYLAVTRQVEQGAPVLAADLRLVAVTPAAGLAAVPATDWSAVLGRHAATTLEPGDLLVPDDLGATVSIPATAALVGTNLNADQLPLGLEPGDPVLVVVGGPSTGVSPVTSGLTAPAAGSGTTVGRNGTSSAASGAGGLLARGVVVSIGPAGSGASAGATGEVVTIEVPATQAPNVAALSAAGDVALAQVPAERHR